MRDVSRRYISVVIIKHPGQGNKGAGSISLSVSEGDSIDFSIPQEVMSGRIEGKHVVELGVTANLDSKRKG